MKSVRSSSSFRPEDAQDVCKKNLSVPFSGLVIPFSPSSLPRKTLSTKKMKKISGFLPNYLSKIKKNTYDNNFVYMPHIDNMEKYMLLL